MRLQNEAEQSFRFIFGDFFFVLTNFTFGHKNFCSWQLARLAEK